MIPTFKKLTIALALMFFLNGCQAMTGQTAGENFDDAAITTSVKTQLATDRFNTLTRVGVETTNSIVYLTGQVETAEQKSQAGAVALRVGGVRRVVNNLQVIRN